jgi:hypothetical protein
MRAIAIKLLDLLLVIYLGIILWILLFGGFSLSIGELSITAHKLKNPLIFLAFFALTRFIINTDEINTSRMQDIK